MTGFFVCQSKGKFDIEVNSIILGKHAIWILSPVME